MIEVKYVVEVLRTWFVNMALPEPFGPATTK
jgi:hypothetical protein